MMADKWCGLTTFSELYISAVVQLSLGHGYMLWFLEWRDHIGLGIGGQTSLFGK